MEFPCYYCPNMGDETPRCNNYERCRKWRDWAADYIVKTLRSFEYYLAYDKLTPINVHPKICDEAADMIEQLQSDNVTLRAQQVREDPKPLTLEELKERVGKPVWCEMQPDYYKCGVIGEKRISEDKKRLVIGFSYGWEWIEDIVRRGTIYDHEPKVTAFEQREGE
ncbi:MAG: hypothetical protein WC455_22140 [Dehalococcoidia bacterium]